MTAEEVNAKPEADGITFDSTTVSKPVIIPNPYVTITMRWVGRWHGFMREDPDTLLVHWRLVQSDDPEGTEVTGVAEDGIAAFAQLKQAHDRAIAKEKIHVPQPG